MRENIFVTGNHGRQKKWRGKRYSLPTKEKKNKTIVWYDTENGAGVRNSKLSRSGSFFDTAVLFLVCHHYTGMQIPDAHFFF